MKTLLKKQGFTLVELIIVIAIIAVLAVAAFMMLTKWLGKSRDSRRLGDLKTIQIGLEVGYSDIDMGSGLYPDISTQEGVVLFYSGSNTVALGYQGIIDLAVAKQANLQKAPLDPGDQKEYTYLVTANRKKFQIMAMLEDGRETTALLDRAFAIDYGDRHAIVRGHTLGVLLSNTGTTVNMPVQFLGVDVLTGIDFADNLELAKYKAKTIDGEFTVSGTGIQELEISTQDPVIADDVIAPTISGISTSEPSCEVVRFSIDGATDNINLASEPFSFDGGVTWIVSSTKDYNTTSKTILSGNIKVKDSSGNIYTHESDEVSEDNYYCLDSNTIMTYNPSVLTGGVEATKYWYDGVTVQLLTNAESLTDGYDNTYDKIIPNIDSQAALFCSNLTLLGETDWYLPAKNELEILYNNRAGKGFGTVSYWSSTEYNGYKPGKYARSLNLADGVWSNSGNKGNIYSVRCIRQVN